VLGAPPASYLLRSEVFFLGSNLLRREADHFPPSNAEVNSEWSDTSTIPMFMACTEATWLLPYF